jgi:DNA-binding CsgD family transcriptional regulator
VIAGARAGQSGVLVLRGGPGIGKSALIEYACQAASDFRVARATGVESEMELAFAGLHQLYGPMGGWLEALPDPQRNALDVAFGLNTGEPPDRFLLSLAALSLLSDVAAERPLLCVVDDAQWLDQASLNTLAFVARRLLAESVALIFATRLHGDALTGLPELPVKGLGEQDAGELLTSVVRGPLDPRVRDRIVAETQGNPLALLELPRGLTSAELAGGFTTPDAPLPARIEASFRQRLEPLPAETRRLVLAAAADPVGDARLLRRACTLLDISPEAAVPAEEAGLFSVGGRVAFFHPLVRSAVYRAASPPERRRVHHALADAIDPNLDPDRRAWHRAHAADGPDDDVAAELERSADRAATRGGLAAAAAFLERSVVLTADPAHRSERALAAAQASHEAGAADAALALLATAAAGPLDEVQTARADRLRARLAFAQRRGGDAPPLLLRAAARLEPLDPALAHETYVEALGAAMATGQRDAIEQASRALRATTPADPPRAAEVLLHGMALLITDGRAAGMSALRQALRAFRREPLSAEDEMQALPYACFAAITVWDDESWHELSVRHVQLAREAGALTILPLALEMHSASQVYAGEFAAAQALLDEASAITEAAGSVPLSDAVLILTSWRGTDAAALPRIETAIRDAADRGETSTITVAEHAAAVLNNGLGRYEEALAAARRSCDHHPAKAYAKSLIEMVEAAVRCAQPQLAVDALDRLHDGTTLGETDWARGVDARLLALLADGQAAASLYEEAIDRLRRTRVRVDLARAHLVYGEWLRRKGRRIDARTQLRAAHELFDEMGAQAFADRAARELRATGETAHKRGIEARLQLTAHEALIAHLARDGLTNSEIGARLFLSPRTVEWHLHNVFTKLEISRRNQLKHVLPANHADGAAVRTEPVPRSPRDRDTV